MKCRPGCECKRHIGHAQSAETRAAISRGHKGRRKSREHRDKLAEATREWWRHHEGPALNRGVKLSEETKRRMSVARLGNQHAYRHGMIATPTHNSWRDMLARCRQPGNPSYRYYGGRGIAVCERWRAFENFLADMGIRPEGKTLDRLDNDRDYEPANCRWATPAEQAANRTKS